MRKICQAVAVVGCLLPWGAHALGVGEIQLQSALNQRLLAEVPLSLADGEDFNDVHVALASPQAFAKLGLERSHFLNSLRFQVVPKGNGHVLKITSSEAIREPFVSFVADINGREGSVSREFTVLLDPPAVFRERQRNTNPPAAAVLVSSTPINTVAAPDTSATPAAEPAVRVPLNASGEHAAAELLVDDRYGPVRGVDTLWSIAKLVSRRNGLSIDAALVALYRANPGAFSKASIHALKPGSVLHIPTAEEAYAMNRAARAARKHQALVANTPAAESVAVPSAPTVNAALPSAPPPPASSDTKPLVLATPTETDSNAKKTKTLSKAELALEMVDTLKQENEEFRTRLAQLEQQLTLAQRLLALKDEQLAEIQNGKFGVGETAAPGVSALAPPPQLPATPPIPITPPPAVAKPAAPVEAAPAPLPPPIAPPPPPSAPPAPVATPPSPATPPVAPPATNPPAAIPAPVAVAPVSAPPPPAPESAKPAPAVATPPAAPPPAQGVDNLTYYATAGGIISALLAVFAWLIQRRRRAAIAAAEQSLAALGSSYRATPSDMSSIDMRRAEPALSSPAIVNVSSSQGAFLSDFTPSDFDVLDGGNDTIDPVSEADVYLAYGRYRQAEELIRQAINDNPFRDACKLKLLEIFYTAQDAAAFEQYAAGLVEEGKNADQDFWARVADMGRSLCPANPLFGGGANAERAVTPESATQLNALSFDFDLDSDQPGVAPSLPIDATTLTPPDALLESEAATHVLEFDLALPEPEASTSAERSSIAGAETTRVGEGSLAFDLDFSLLEAAEAAPTPSAAAPAAAPLDIQVEAPAEPLALEFDFALADQSAERPSTEHTTAAHPESVAALEPTFDFDFSPESVVTVAATEAPGPVASFINIDLDADDKLGVDFDFGHVEPAQNTDLAYLAATPTEIASDQEYDEHSLIPFELTERDAVDTRLDLAKAYMDMENHAAAKLMLDSAVREGNEAQRREAQSLLDQLVDAV